MRVVHVYKDIYPVLGGIENHVRLLCRELAKRHGIDVRILVTSTTRRSSVDRLDGVPVIRAARMAHLASTPLSPRLGLELRRLRPDVVHLHFPYPPGEVAALLATPSVPKVITYHSDIVRQRLLLRLYGPVLKVVLSRAARILPTSPQYLARSQWLGEVRDRCTVVPLGIDPGPFVRLERQGDGRTLLFVGRFRYYKGLHYLLQAMVQLPGARLVLVGGGPLEATLRLQADELGVSERVEFATGVEDEDLPRYYARADVFVLPACEPSEAFGLVLAEAAASGLPCVSTELGTGTSFVNVDGETGLVVPPADPNGLAEACGRLLADSTLRQEYGRAGRARALALFDIRRVAEDVAAIYGEVSGKDGYDSSVPATVASTSSRARLEGTSSWTVTAPG